MVCSKSAMENQQQQPAKRWPFDLRVFAILAGLWAVCLVMRAFVHPGELDVVDPVQAVFGGILFDGDAARIVMIVEAGIFASIAIGVFTEQRWGLLLALCFMAQVVMSHLAFVIANLPLRFAMSIVRATAMQGPMMVLITLYLWIRATDLIFDAPASPRQAPRIRTLQDHKPMRPNSVAAGFEK
jgi:hypothetical protein